MTDVISDTGPILHLNEINRASVLTIFDSIIVPDLVAEELRGYNLINEHLAHFGVTLKLLVVEKQDWLPFVRNKPTPIQPADAQVCALALSGLFPPQALTDDLALRRELEQRNVQVIGSVGILVRAYSQGHLDRTELDDAIDALFGKSSLYVSRAFRVYVKKLLAVLP